MHFFGFLNHIPVIEMLMVLVVGVGAVYYLAVQRGKPPMKVVPPEEEVEGTAAATPA